MMRPSLLAGDMAILPVFLIFGVAALVIAVVVILVSITALRTIVKRSRSRKEESLARARAEVSADMLQADMGSAPAPEPVQPTSPDDGFADENKYESL